MGNSLGHVRGIKSFQQTVTYDYLIVGAGSAGSVLAERLSVDPAIRVLVVESGPDDRSPLIGMPRGIGVLLQPGNPHISVYDVAPGGNGPTEVWVKGHAVGGSSSINGSVYMRGMPHDYDSWAAAGCTGWGWSEMKRCFVALEKHQLGATDWRGAAGPLPIGVHPPGNPLCEAVLQSATQIGTPRFEDINDPAIETSGGLGYQTRNICHGKRVSAGRAFLRPARKRPNLDVVTSARVERVAIENRRATGVHMRTREGEWFVAAREVILCAGAIETPKLLQLSGIGPAPILQAVGIPVLINAPEVGENLREHRYVQTVYQVKGGSMNGRFRGLGLARSLLEYALAGRGALTHAAYEVGGVVKSRPDLAYADSQVGVSLYSLDITNGAVAVGAGHGLTILSYYGHPESLGTIRIASPDPGAQPLINANHFSAAVDRDATVSLFRWLRKLGTQAPLQDWIVQEQSPGAQIETVDEILSNALGLGGTASHIAGTCRMGPDDRSVVDPRTRMRGIDGLRICDTSIMPTLVCGNTNAPAMAMGYRTAELILEDRAKGS